MNLGDTFDGIYGSRRWGVTESRSGRGSSLRATRDLVPWIEGVVHRHGITSVLDAACGDCYWMPDLPGYIGVDAAPRAIRAARRNRPDRDFRVLDVTVDPLPRCDLVIFRDAIQHLPLRDGCAALTNIRESGALFLITNTNPAGKNINIQAGRLFSPDLTAAPFNCSEPEEWIADDRGTSKDRGKRLGLWRLRA